MTAGWNVRRRFWKAAGVEPEASGWSIRLDGRPLRTPAGAPLIAPNETVARASAQEWAAQAETIEPASMPVTRALNSAIDRVAPQRDAVVAEIAGYGATDLLCYRAPGPSALTARQAQAWDPWLAWSRNALGAGLVCAEGIMHVAQPPEAVARLAAQVSTRDAYALTALFDLTALSGSLILGLAVESGALAPDDGWTISRIDEAWQAEQWGEDAEAAKAAARKAVDFAAAARLAALLRQG
jgi:chaperone required for assembly of F1-ATPase